MESLGLIEVSSVTGALDALDVMCKTANVSFVTWERKLGGRLVTIIVKGSVAAVTEAVDAAMARGLVKPCAHAVIANPHEETARIVEISASRLKKKG
ncbi:MAG: BMC domain-containing protein [Clostridia bacterium]|nr:BMC domain-containing protein [Clostridia bacterium]MBP5312363.1 BMC domain-containing protein [Clostridia bacterium]